MPFSLESLAIVLVVSFFGVALALLVNSFPAIKQFVDTMVEAVKSLKKFKRQKPL